VLPTEDSSYPPVDLDTDFFASHGSHRGPPSDPLDTEDHRDPRLTLKHTPGVALRRKELTKYVKVAVGLSAALCLAALVKVAVAGHGESPVPRRQTAAQSGPPLQPAGEPEQARVLEPAPSAARPEPPAPSSAEQREIPTPAPSALETAPGASAAPPSAPSDQAPAAPATATQAEQPSEPDPVQAGKEKTASRIALERGRLAAAIEAGERSVALDPTDGEAWLILGAAYQEKGNAKDARRCYKTCLEQAKRGPRGECAAMLR
jgi:hypothetical protein